MGTHLETHIGAYIKIEVAPIISENVEMVCNEHGDEKYNETDEFCSICGKELIKIVTKTEEEAGYYDLFKDEDEEEKYEDELNWLNGEDEDTTIILGGNTGSLDKPDMLEDDYGAIEIAQEVVRQYKENFKQNYKNIIDLLTPRVESLEVKFGVIIYYA